MNGIWGGKKVLVEKATGEESGYFITEDLELYSITTIASNGFYQTQETGT